MYKVTEDGNTLFQLAAGTELQLGSETIVLTVDTDVFIRKSLSRESIAETLVGSRIGATSVKLLDDAPKGTDTAIEKPKKVGRPAKAKN